MKYETLPVDIGSWKTLFDLVKGLERLDRKTPMISAPRVKTDTVAGTIGYRTKGGDVSYFSDSEEDIEKLLGLYETLKLEGFEIHEVPYTELAKRFGDYVGYRDGNMLYVALDDGKRKLSAKEKAYIAAHEAREKKDSFDVKPHEQVHREAEDMLAGLNHYSALDVARGIGRKMRWIN